MTDQGFSSDFFDDAEDVRTYARKRVSEFICGQYPDINALDARRRSAIVDDGAAHVAMAMLKKIDAGEPIDLLSLTTRLTREFLTKRGFKPSASAESVRSNGRRARATVTDDLVTEDSVASAFTLQHAGELRYCHHAGRWYEWTGNVWRMNETGIVLQQIRELTRAVSAGAEAKVRTNVNKVSFASGAERFSKHDPKFAVTSKHWDKDPMLLGTPGGTVDLRTGELRPGDQADGITKSTAVAPVPRAICPIWLKFLSEATGGNDREMVQFLRRWFGYALTGDTSEHQFVFVHGPGGNGKSAWLNTVAGIIGEYHRVAPIDTFTESGSDRHPTDLAALRGARLVSATETEEGRPWAESKIKQMTGGDTIAARFMRQDFFEYRPQFKLTIVGNHKPSLRNVDDAMRRRINIVPFEHKPKEPDLQLEEKLKSEWPAILRWAIDGCLDWQITVSLGPSPS
jgi:putative DNA primase/helicase